MQAHQESAAAPGAPPYILARVKRRAETDYRIKQLEKKLNAKWEREQAKLARSAIVCKVIDDLEKLNRRLDEISREVRRNRVRLPGLYSSLQAKLQRAFKSTVPIRLEMERRLDEIVSVELGRYGRSRRRDRVKRHWTHREKIRLRRQLGIAKHGIESLT